MVSAFRQTQATQPIWRLFLNFIARFIANLLAVVISITVHEFSHALSADLLGDPTPRYRGRLTLNPAAHFDPIGAMMILLSSISGFGFGWGKPVAVSATNLRFGPRVGFALTAFAGPFSNIVLATLFAIPIRVAMSQGIMISPIVWELLLIGVSVNIANAVFNLLPIPPLDGNYVLRGVLSLIRTRWAYEAVSFLDQMVTWGPWLFLGLIMLDNILPLRRGLIWTLLWPFFRLLWWLTTSLPI
jgi:Zn-dependent protease